MSDKPELYILPTVTDILPPQIKPYRVDSEDFIPIVMDSPESVADTPLLYILPPDRYTTPPNILPYHLKTSNLNLSEYTIVNYMDEGKPAANIIMSNIAGTYETRGLILVGQATAAEIKIAYESNPDTNAYTDLDKLIVSTISGALAAEIIARYDSDIVMYNTMSEVRQSIPTALYQLLDDSTHRLVTDSEKEIWNEKIGSMDIIDGGLF